MTMPNLDKKSWKRPDSNWISLWHAPFKTAPQHSLFFGTWNPSFSDEIVTSCEVDFSKGLFLMQLNHPPVTHSLEYSVVDCDHEMPARITGHPLAILHDPSLHHLLNADFDRERLLRQVRAAWDDLLEHFWMALDRFYVVARAPKPLSDFIEISPDSFAHFTIIDWGNGTARAQDGSYLFSIHVTARDSAVDAEKHPGPKTIELIELLEHIFPSDRYPAGVPKGHQGKKLKNLLIGAAEAQGRSLTADDKTIRKARSLFDKMRKRTGLSGTPGNF